MNILEQRQNRIILLLFMYVLMPGLLWQLWFKFRQFAFALLHKPRQLSDG